MKKLKYIKVFENFTEQDKKTKDLLNAIDNLQVDDYIKNSLKNNDDLIIIWNKHYWLNQGIKELMSLFEPSSVVFWNGYINDLKQDSHIESFYEHIEDFIEVLDRLIKFLEHPEKSYIMTNILGYCHPVALRYMTEKSVNNILQHKDLIRKFQALWVTKMTDGSPSNSSCNIFMPDKSDLTGVRPFVPTSEEEHDRKIEEIIMDKYSKEVK